MDNSPEPGKIKDIIDTAEHIVVVQADNPDIDSLASSLAMESILTKLGKQVSLYCGVDLPSYLHYLPGWDRVSSELPNNFDASVIVDTSSNSLLEQLQKRGSKGWLASKPAIILDHHATEPTIDFAEVIYNPPAVATAEIIYELAHKLSWPLEEEAKDLIAVAILSDSLGLMSESTAARSIQIIAELVESGVNLPKLDNARRETLKRPPELVHYKGRLLQRVEFHYDNKIAMVTIPYDEIEKYSPFYNPSMLVIDDMRLATGTEVAIAFKVYKDGKVTAKIRCNWGKGIADKLAERFGGGGHPLAAGFKVTDGRDFAEIKKETVNVAMELLSKVSDGPKSL